MHGPLFPAWMKCKQTILLKMYNYLSFFRLFLSTAGLTRNLSVAHMTGAPRFSHLYCRFSLAYIGYGEATRVISDESIFHCILQLFRAEAWGTGECHFCRR